MALTASGTFRRDRLSESAHRIEKFSDIWGICLAGGRSSRMGIDKAQLLAPNGKTFLSRCFDTLASFLPEVFVSCSPNRPYAGYPLIYDEYPSLGPIGGVFSALKKASAAKKKGIFILACDLPLIIPELLIRLAQSHIDVCANATLYRDPENGFLETTVCLYSVKCLQFFKKAIECKRLRLSSVLPENSWNILIPLPEEKNFFLNCNTRLEYRNLWSTSP